MVLTKWKDIRQELLTFNSLYIVNTLSSTEGGGGGKKRITKEDEIGEKKKPWRKQSLPKPLDKKTKRRIYTGLVSTRSNLTLVEEAQAV